MAVLPYFEGFRRRVDGNPPAQESGRGDRHALKLVGHDLKPFGKPRQRL
jgi:hypothetical protein